MNLLGAFSGASYARVSIVSKMVSRTSHLISLVALILLVLSGCVDSDANPEVHKVERARVIRYDRALPIASRLLPQDDVVTVKKSSFPPLIAMNTGQTLDEGLDDAMRHDAVVLATGLTNGGVLIDNGTWIRGKVTGSIVEVIKATSQLDAASGRVTFSHQDGELFLKSVLIRAGTYPVFVAESQYLLFLGHAHSVGWYLGRGLAVAGNGELTGIFRSNGEMPITTHVLYGQPLSKVMPELRRRLQRK